MSKDFFDEEYDKVTQNKETQQASDINDWYSYSSSEPNPAKNPHRSIYIVLICVALIISLVLGWVLCSIFSGTSNSSKEEEIIADVVKYLQEEYYLDVTDAQMHAALEAAGTAMLQSAGDRYCQLMSPQTYYDYVNQTNNVQVVGLANNLFGFSYNYSDGLGFVVSSVSADSSSYGLLFAGDIVLKMTNVTYNELVIAANGLDIDRPAEINISQIDYAQSIVYLAAVQSANFRVLRNGDVVDTGVINRGRVGLERPDPKYDYSFVEFYFDKNHTNISTKNQNNAKTNTYDLRGLSRLPADTGYIHLTQFMYYVENGKTITAANEFAEVMRLFKSLGKKRLILDLKGNPGGSVSAVCDVASMLITDEKLSVDQKKLVSKNSDLLVTTLIPRDESKTETYYRISHYSDYFGTPSATCDIVVWTDGNSASASELLTGTLVDYGTGFQIGEKTYGKGIAQTVRTLPITGSVKTTDGKIASAPWAIYYTFASYYSPLGTNIHGTGYAPTQGYNGITQYVSQTETTLWDATYRYWGI